MNTLENTELTALIRHIAIFLKSEIPIYNSEVPDTAGKKREEEVVEEENRELQGAMRFTQTQ